MAIPRQPDAPAIELVDQHGETTLYIDQQQAMQAWELELMHRSADIVCRAGSEFLEVGLGLGLSALRIAGHPSTHSHIVLEKYQRVIDLFRETHPQLPATLEIVHSDFLDYLHQVAPASLDGILFDPFLPAEIRNDRSFWDEVMPVMTRALRPGGVFVPYFSTRPILYWTDYFETVVVERHPFETYATTEYTSTVSGYAFIQAYSRPSFRSRGD